MQAIDHSAPVWLAGLLVLLVECAWAGVIRISGPAQGTTWSVQVVAPREGLDAATIRQAMRAELAAVDALVSLWRPDSALARFNAAPAGQWIPVPAELAALAHRALVLGRWTNGAFNITLAPVLRLWGFGPGVGEPAIPDEDALQTAMRKVGLEHVAVRLQPPALRKARPGVKLTLAGIAQGYTVDRMVARLDAMGVDRYLVELGGELYARGRNAQGQIWRIGIEQPTPGLRTVRSVVALNGYGISTSGDYRNFFVVDGQRYSHILDPRTGRPIRHDLHSVTVIHRSVARADALATALLVMGPEAGPGFARKHDITALFILGESGAFTAIHTGGFASFLVEPATG